MQKRSAFMAEPIKGFMFQKILGRLATNVFAESDPVPDEDNETTPSTTSANQINFEQMVAQARKEEKDKLYPRIKKLEEDNKTLVTSSNKFLLENAALKDEIEKLKSDSGNDTKVKDLESKINTLEAENKSLKESSPKEEEIRKKVEEEFEVKMYAQEQITANKDSIISILVPEITGTTKEEIDKAIVSAKEKTVTIKKDLGIDVEEDEEGEDEGDKAKKKTAPAKKAKKVPAAVPSSEQEDEYDAEYVRNLDPRSEEYKEFRKKMGLR